MEPTGDKAKLIQPGGDCMGDFVSKHWEHLIGRVNGPLSFRLIIQPLVAALLGVRAGLQDARKGQPRFGWYFLTTRRGNRNQLVREAWKHIGKLFLAAIAIDVIYEIYVVRWVYPLWNLIVATILAVPSYVAVRGLTNQIARRRVQKQVG
jgi:hypothetical protein